MAEQAELTILGTDVVAMVLKALCQLTEPISATNLRSQIPELFRPNQKRFDELLEQSVAKGIVWKYAPSRGKASCFLDRPIEKYAREIILSELTKAPCTIAQLKKNVSSRLREISDARRSEILSDLIANKEVSELPKKPGGRSSSYSTKPPNPREYLANAARTFQKAVEKIAKLLNQAGVEKSKTVDAARDLINEQFESEPAEDSLVGTVNDPKLTDLTDRHTAESSVPLETSDERIVEKIVELREASGNPLILIAELRRLLDLHFSDKSSFDDAILSLSRQGKIALHRDDYSQRLSPHDRDMLVTDGENYFSGVALRQ